LTRTRLKLGNSLAERKASSKEVKLPRCRPHALGRNVPFGMAPHYSVSSSDAAFFYTNPPLDATTVFTGEYSPNTLAHRVRISPSVHHPRTAATIGRHQIVARRVPRPSEPHERFLCRLCVRSARTRGGRPPSVWPQVRFDPQNFPLAVRPPPVNWLTPPPYEIRCFLFNLTLVMKCRILNFCAACSGGSDGRDRGRRSRLLRQVLDRLAFKLGYQPLDVVRSHRADRSCPRTSVSCAIKLFWPAEREQHRGLSPAARAPRLLEFGMQRTGAPPSTAHPHRHAHDVCCPLLRVQRRARGLRNKIASIELCSSFAWKRPSLFRPEPPAPREISRLPRRIVVHV